MEFLKYKIFGVKLYWYLAILAIVLVISLFVFRTLKHGASTKTTPSKQSKATPENSQRAKDIEHIRKLIDASHSSSLDDKTKDFILAQSALETAWWTSNVYKRNNNLFGMREAHYRTRDQEGDTDGDGFANYVDESQSVRDHRLWLEENDMYKNFSTPAAYVKSLKAHGYFEEPASSYTAGLTSFLKQIQS
jgi:flagellum-specific peptidoglycan hydrolase FlgJ